MSPRLPIFLRVLSLILPLAALAGCAAGTGRPSANAPPAAAAPQQAAPDHLAEARAQEQAAARAAPPQSYEYHLRAAEAAADGGDYGYAGAILAVLPAPSLDPPQQQRQRLLYARMALVRNDAAGALKWLAQIPPGSPLAERAMLLRGRAQFRVGDPVGAVQTLVQREHLLGTTAAQAENHDAIWSGLGAATLNGAVLARASDTDPVSRGWVELANLSRRNASLEQYESWRRRYPGHPAQEQLANLMMPNAPPLVARASSPPAGTAVARPPAPSAPVAAAALPVPIPAAPGVVSTPQGPPSAAAVMSAVPAAPAAPLKPGFYALLLPQDGPLGAIAEAIRSGFVEAAGRAGNQAELRVYDAGNPAAAINAYNQAIHDGAGVVMGPLLKNDVAALAQSGAVHMPMLALNYLDTGRGVPAGFYQFGLAPEDEARAAAEDAVSRGLQRALVLVPDSERGTRVLSAFSQRLGELGATTVDSGRYWGEPKDWSAPVSALLHYRAVEDRKKREELRANAAPGIDPQRRNDFDFVFIDAAASQARVLWPLFRYYHAERMPIYDTAAVNEGQGDQDLAGIRFCDAPWMLEGGDAWSGLRAAALGSGRSIELARFYAMGDDSYQLALRLGQNNLHPLDELPGASGTLRVGDDDAVRRSLVCAQTTEGDPRRLEPPAAAAP